MLVSIAFFAGMCLFLGVTIHAWAKGDSMWGILFILCTLFFSFVFVDHTFYGGEAWQMFAEWVVSLQHTE